nr:E3 ubiquitin-protein ligase PUB23-like [Tanacetum cinerariifolium]
MEAAGAVEYLTYVLNNHNNNNISMTSSSVGDESDVAEFELVTPSDEALGRNRIRAAESSAVPALIDILLDSSDKRLLEMALLALDQLCQCAEGRSELLKHGAGLAVVSKKIFRVSPIASDRAVRIVYSVAKYSGNGGVMAEMLQIGVVGKLCLVLQVDCGSKMKEKAIEILKMHARVWSNSPCIPHNLISSYPS